MTPEISPRILRFLGSPRPLARLILVLAPPHADTTLFLLQVAMEIRRGAILGVNYVNPRDSAGHLARRYPYFRRCFTPNGLDRSWLRTPARRTFEKPRLEALLELVVGGRAPPAEIEPEADWSLDEIKPYDPRDDPAVGGSWRSAPPLKVVKRVSEGPILPEYESLWGFAERAPRLPGLVIIDSIDGLARHYDVEASRLVGALREDLINPGLVNALVVYEKPDRPDWMTTADGVLSWQPLAGSKSRRCWSLTIESLVGRDIRQREYVLAFDRGRLEALPSDDDFVRELLSMRKPRTRPGVPSEVIEIFLRRNEAKGVAFDL